MNILLIHRDPVYSAGLIEAMKEFGVSVKHEMRGDIGLQMAISGAFDAIVISACMPCGSGVEICRVLRVTYRVSNPIMVIGRNGGVESVVAAMEAGADHYGTDSVHCAELHARLRAMCRRREVHGVLRVGDLVFDTGACEAYRQGERLKLVPLELGLLQTLMEASPRLVGRAELTRRLWGSGCNALAGKYLRHVVYTLRKEVDKRFGHPLIHTHYRIGYRIAAAVETSSANIRHEGAKGRR